LSRIIFLFLIFLFHGGACAWAQEVDPGGAQDANNLRLWLVILSPSFVGLLFILVLLRSRKKLVVRSMEISEERLQLARRQVALQEETNRLLEQMVLSRGRVE